MSNVQEKHLKELENRIEEEKDRLSGILHEVNNQHGIKQKVEREIAKLQERQKLEQERLDEYKIKREAYEDELHELNETRRAVQQDITKLRTQHDELAADIDSFDKTAKKRTDQHERELALSTEQQRKELDKLKVEKEGIVTDMRRAQDSLRKAEGDREVVVGNLRRLVEEQSKLRSENGTLANKNEDIERSVDSNEKLLASQKGQLATLEAQISDRKKEVHTLTDKVGTITKDIEKLQAEHSEVNKQYEVDKRRLFAIADRENKLWQDEEYVKAKFKEAGLPYNEPQPYEGEKERRPAGNTQ